MTQEEYHKSRPTMILSNRLGFSSTALVMIIALGVFVYQAGSWVVGALAGAFSWEGMEVLLNILKTLPYLGLGLACLAVFDHFVFMVRSLKHDRLLSGKNAPSWVLHQENSPGRRYLERKLDPNALEVADLLVKENFTGTLGELVVISKEFSTP